MTYRVVMETDARHREVYDPLGPLTTGTEGEGQGALASHRVPCVPSA